MSKTLDTEAVNHVTTAKVGDAIILKDLITLQNCDGAEFNGIITEVNRWDTGNGVVYHGIEVEPSDDITLLVLVRVSNDGKDVTTRLFRKYIETLACDLDETIIQDKSGEDDEDLDLTFGPFTTNIDDSEVEYGIVRPTPFYLTQKSDEEKVAVCEYKPTNIEYEEDEFNSAFGFCEWYAYNGTGEEGLVTLWLGWKILADDFEVYNIKKTI